MMKLIWWCPQCGATFDRYESDRVMACGTCPVLVVEATLEIVEHPRPRPDPLEVLLIDAGDRKERV